MDGMRIFVAGVSGITILTPAPGVEEAYDVLVAGGVAPQKAADLAIGFARIGKDPVLCARKFLRARSAVFG
jgi:alanine dehydrogenase